MKPRRKPGQIKHGLIPPPPPERDIIITADDPRCAQYLDALDKVVLLTPLQEAAMLRQLRAKA